MSSALQKWRDSVKETMGISIPGTVVAMAKKSGPIGVVTSGEADIEAKTPIAPSTSFHVGSISKLFTAALILKLAQENKLSLTDPVSKFLDYVPNGSNIEVRMLIQHTSGLPDLDTTTISEEQTPREIAEANLGQAAPEAPGETFRYNNLGYILLGLIAEEVTQTTWAEEVKTRFLDPLGMKNTYVYAYQTGAEAVKGYDIKCEGATAEVCIGKPSELEAVSHSAEWKAAWSAGGMVSTAVDLVVWIRALVAGDVLDAEHKNIMITLTPQSADQYRDAYIAAGKRQLALGEGTGLQGFDVEGVGDCWGHAGSISGSNGIAAYCPDKDVAIAILNNISIAGDNPLVPGLEQLTPAAIGALENAGFAVNSR